MYEYKGVGKLVLPLVAGGILLFLLFLFFRGSSKVEKSMNISSPAFDNNTKIPSKYTCDGENISPPLLFYQVPQNAKSLVLIVDDPDAVSKTWVHWTVFNIDPTISDVPENSVPKNGIEGMTDFGTTGYGGPCPPSGIHRYVFKLYALDSTLDLSSAADKKAIEEKMQGHVLEKAELIGLYERR